MFGLRPAWINGSCFCLVLHDFYQQCGLRNYKQNEESREIDYFRLVSQIVLKYIKQFGNYWHNISHKTNVWSPYSMMTSVTRMCLSGSTYFIVYKIYCLYKSVEKKSVIIKVCSLYRLIKLYAIMILCDYFRESCIFAVNSSLFIFIL